MYLWIMYSTGAGVSSWQGSSAPAASVKRMPERSPAQSHTVMRTFSVRCCGAGLNRWKMRVSAPPRSATGMRYCMEPKPTPAPSALLNAASPTTSMPEVSMRPAMARIAAVYSVPASAIVSENLVIANSRVSRTPLPGSMSWNWLNSTLRQPSSMAGRLGLRPVSVCAAAESACVSASTASPTRLAILVRLCVV